MIFYLEPSYTEYILIALFIIGILFYIFLLKRKTKVLKTTLRYLFFKPVLRASYFGMGIIALLGPVLGVEKKEVKVVGKDIMLLVDVSESMNAMDIQPSRLEKVKFELNQVIGAFTDSRIGLVVFSADAALQCPLTYDHRIIKDIFLKSINSTLMYGGGTDFEKALDLVYTKFEKDKSIDGSKRAKVAILISDGEHFGESYTDITKSMAKDNITVFTVGVGTTEGSKIPTRNGFKLDKEQKEVISKLNDKDLKEIADRTEGRYFELNNVNNEIPKLIAQIQNIKGQKQDIRTLDTQANKYVYVLWMMLFLVVLDILITVRVIKL